MGCFFHKTVVKKYGERGSIELGGIPPSKTLDFPEKNTSAANYFLGMLEHLMDPTRISSPRVFLGWWRGNDTCGSITGGLGLDPSGMRALGPLPAPGAPSKAGNFIQSLSWSFQNL